MHSHERTYLASLGFCDPDKKVKSGELLTHDVACQYLAIPDNSLKLARLVSGKEAVVAVAYDRDRYSRETIGSPEWASHLAINWWMGARRGNETTGYVMKDSSIEVHLSKGEGQYRTTIGFLDVVIRYEMVTEFDGERECIDASLRQHLWSLKTEEDRNEYVKSSLKWAPLQNEKRIDRKVCVEVKIAQVGTSDLIRQLNLYRQYFDADGWVAATAYDISKDDLEALQKEGIKHVRLGEKFNEYLNHRKATRSVSSDSPVI